MCPFKHIAASVQQSARVARSAVIRYPRWQLMNAMNGLDYLAVALFVIGAIYGLQRGALRMVTSVVSLAAAIYFASLYYTRAGAFAETQLSTSHTVGAVIGYVAVFALIFSAVEMIGDRKSVV